MDKFNDFILLYKELENECRENGLEIKELEETLDSAIASKLRMCRMFRNYIQHEAGYKNFLSIAPEMMNFLKDFVNKYKQNGDIVGKHLIKIENCSCNIKDKISDGLQKASKLKREEILVFDKELLGTASIYEMTDLFLKSKTAKFKDIKKYGKNYEIVSFDTKMEDKPDGLVLCEKNGKVFGVVK